MPEIKQDLRTATMIVAADDSLHKNMANYICPGTNDDVEIQAALDAVAAGVGLVGRVILLDGSYNCTADITVPDSITLEGQGYASRLYFGGPAIVNAITVGGDYVSVKNLAAYLNAGAGAGVGTRPNVVYAANRDHVWLENLIITGDESVADDGSDLRQCGILFDGGGYSKIINCKCEDCDRHGIHLRNNINSTVEGNTCTSNTLHGIFLSTGADWSSVVGNNCDLNDSVGILVENSNDCTITGNDCDNNSSGIEIYNALNCTVSGNTCVDNTAFGITVEEGSHNNTITGNTCANNDSGGMNFDGIRIIESDENVITGNQCEGNGRHGIYILLSSYCTITGNVCNNQSSDDGINVTGDVTGDADYNVIASNVCHNNAGNGVEIVGGTDANYNSVKANNTIGNTGRGIVDAGTYTIFDQVMHSIALDLTGGATDIEVFFAKCPCILAGYSILYSVATGAGAGVNIRVGRYQDGMALDDDYFDVSVSELNKAKGYSKHFVSADLTQTVIAAGDAITVGTAGGKVDTGEVILILEIAEMSD